MRITEVTIERLSLPLDPPLRAAWDPSRGRASTPRSCAWRPTRASRASARATRSTASRRTPGCSWARTRCASRATPGRSRGSPSTPAGRWPVEPALWDLAGQALGVPVATLLGGATDRLPAYASLAELRSPAARAEDAVALREQGFRALKLRIPRDRVEEGLRSVAAIRAAVGDGMDLLVDLNQWWRMPGDVAAGMAPPGPRRVVDAWARTACCGSRSRCRAPTCGACARCASTRGSRSRAARWRAVRRARRGARAGRARRLPARRGARAGHVPGADARRARARAQPVVHAAHVDERDRPAGQPAPRVRRRRRPLPRVPLRPARLDPGAPGLHARRAGRHRRRRLPAGAQRPGLGAGSTRSAIAQSPRTG